MNEVQKALRLMAIATILLFSVVIALGVYVLIQQRRTHEALCNFRGDLEQRVDSTQRFLDDHPGREPIPGVARTSLQQSLDNQRRTVNALSDLNCT